MAFCDPLTNLPNRRLLQDRLQQALSQAQRNHRCLALMFLDLDQFKPVNDALGHQAGDDLLRLVAQRLLTCVRVSDTVARMGGDEFVLLLPNIDTAQDALGVAEKIHAALRQPFTLPGGAQVAISSSTGIALYPAHGTDGTTLTSHADTAMYQAKSAGRDRFVLFQATD
jgi:diguanylate cyclase (GGDEF)-like protein